MGVGVGGSGWGRWLGGRCLLAVQLENCLGCVFGASVCAPLNAHVFPLLRCCGSTPPAQVPLVANTLPAAVVPALLGALGELLPQTPHLEHMLW